MPPPEKPKKSGGTGSHTHALSVVQEFMKEFYYAGRREKEKEGEDRRAGEKVAQEMEAEVNAYMADAERRKATMQELKELSPNLEELLKKIADADETTNELCELVDSLEAELLRRTDGRFLKVGAELHQLRERIKALQLENEQLERNLQSSSSATEKQALEKTITSLRADLEAKERTSQLIKPALEKVKKKIDAEKERVRRRNDTIAQLKKKYEILQVRTGEEKAIIEKEKSALETQALELNQRIREQDEALKDSQIRLKDCETRKRQLEESLTEKGDLEKQVLELRSQVDSVLEGEQSAREQVKKYSDRHTRAKRQVRDLEEQLSSARKEINDLKEKRTRDEYALKVSRAETRLARDAAERMMRAPSTPTPFPVVQTSSRTSGPGIELLSSHSGSRLSTLPVIQEDEEMEKPGLYSTPGSSSLQPHTPKLKDKANVRAKRHQTSAETMAEARRLLNEVVFKTGENEFSISTFPDDVQANFANAISNLLDKYRADPDAYNLKPNRMKCLPCTNTRPCESGDGDFTCKTLSQFSSFATYYIVLTQPCSGNWCESNASLCITRTEGRLFVAPREQEETTDLKSKRYWLSGPRLKRRRRTGLELLA